VKFFYKPGDPFARYTHSGSIELPYFIELGKKIREFSDKNKIFLILLDLTKASGDLSLLDRYFLGEQAVTILGLKIKLSIFCREDQMYRDKFGARVANSKGAKVNVFTDLDEAEKWLISKG